MKSKDAKNPKFLKQRKKKKKKHGNLWYFGD